ncbi:MAG: methyltransferase domain-containing protein [Chitinophagaceae bacterium]
MGTKEIQGKLWSIAPSNWSNLFEPGFLPMYRHVTDKLDLKNSTLLDAGCGSGMFSSMAAAAGAQVTGVDAAAGLLRIARERNPASKFTEEDLESLSFKDETFDIVAGFNSFQYAGSFPSALQEAKRVLKTGGTLVIGIWAKPELSEATRVLKAIGSLLPPPPPGTPGPFALSEDGRMESELAAVGLELTDRASIACPFLYHTLEDAVDSFMGTGPAAAALNFSPKHLVEKAAEEALGQFRITEGIHFLQNQFLVFMARK